MEFEQNMNQIFEVLYLQLPQAQALNVSVLALIVSSITMTIFAITLLITWRSTKESNKVNYAKLMRSFHEDLTQRLDKNVTLKTTEDCERYANDFLNTLDEIAYLTLNDKIPKNIGMYLKRFFAYGLIIIDWYNDMIRDDYHKIAKENWPNYFEFCKKYNISINSEDKLPKIMREYNKIKEKEDGE